MKLLDYQAKNIQQNFKTNNAQADLEQLLHIALNLHLRLNHYIDHRGSIPIRPVINWNIKLGDFLESLKANDEFIEVLEKQKEYNL